MAKALRISVGPKAAGTAKFCEMLDKFLDCLNVKNLEEGKHKRIFKTPYQSTKDFRLKVHMCVYYFW